MTPARQQANVLAELLRRERDALAEFLSTLAEFDRRGDWVRLGHASLFAFLVKDLGLSNGAAAYRKAAVELVQRFPQVLEPVRDGRLCITTVFELSKVITNENAAEVLPRFFGTSKRDAKNVVAELAPTPAPERTVITAVAAASRDSRTEVHDPSGRLADQMNANSSPAPQLSHVPQPAPRTVVEPKTAELSRVHVTVPRRLLEKLKVATDALSHSHPNASDAEVLEVGLDLIIARYLKRRGIGAKPRKKTGAAPAPEAPATAPPVTKRSRYVPAEVRRAVWERDGGRCAFPLENGGVCGSTSQLELDHIKGFALGAGNTADELRLACRPHQDVHASRLYGDDPMNNYTRPKGPRCSEPVAVWEAATRAPEARRDRWSRSTSRSRSRSGSRSASGSRSRTLTRRPRACHSGPVAMRTENLAVMLTDMKGFTAATSRQSRAENARMLALLDELVVPVVRAFRGRRVKTIGDAYLILFDSPTAALLCGAALQDRLWDHSRRVGPEERIEMKVVVSLGEVRLIGGGVVPRDVYGEAVNLAARVESEASAGEVWFTEAARLVADPVQIAAEDLGARTLKGIAEEVRLYRIRPAQDGADGPPYGNVALSRVVGVSPPDPAILARAMRHRSSPLFAAGRAVAELLAAVPLRAAAALVVVLALAAGGWRWYDGTVERQIARGDLAGAERAIVARAATHGDGDAKVLYLKGCLAEARAAAGRGSLRDAFNLWTRAAVAGSGDALDALDAQGESWECDRRRLAARALAETRSPAALRALRRLDEREPVALDAYGRVRHFLGADGQCGAGDIARDAIRRLEAEKR